MASESRDVLHVAPQFQPVFRELGIDAQAVFALESIKPWRTLSDRENCTLDATLADGRRIRWHVKRYRGSRPVERELRGFELLHAASIPTAMLVGWGTLGDGRGFVITEDLAGYDDAEKLVARGDVAFERLLAPTAELAARLHGARLHHRDLYLCHFFADQRDDVRLIDVARVNRLPPLLAQRWILKDLAQFWFSTLLLPITDAQRDAWLQRYAQRRAVDPKDLRRPLERKVAWIARHDARLRRRQPHRNISIPRP